MTAPTPAPVEVAPAANVPAETPAPAVVQPVPTPASMPPAAPQPTAVADVDDSDDVDATDTVSAAERKARREAKNLRDRLTASDAARAALEQRMAAYEQSATEAAAQKAQWDKLAAVFNPASDEPVDPAKLAEQLASEKAALIEQAANDKAALEAQLRTHAVERAAEQAARRAGVDVDALLDSRTFATTVAKLDPTSDTFTADLESAVGAAVSTNPKLKTAPVAVRSGAEIAGRSGASDQITDRSVLANMSTAEIETARQAGRFKALGIGPDPKR